MDDARAEWSGIDWGADPWRTGWAGPEVVAVASATPDEGLGGAGREGGSNEEHPGAAMFAVDAPVALAVAVCAAAELAGGLREEVGAGALGIVGARDALVVVGTDDPRAWFAVTVEDGGAVSALRTTRCVLGPALARALDGPVGGYLRLGRPLPRAVAAALAAWEVFAEGSFHDGVAALGPLRGGGVVTGGWRRGWISPVEEVRAVAVGAGLVNAAAVRLLATDRSWAVRMVLAGTRLAEPALAAALAEDGDEAVRSQYLHTHGASLPVEVLTTYSGDPSTALRWQLAATDGLPVRIYEHLAGDADDGVAARAAAQLR